jgi:CxxC motif-containing protein
MGLLNTIKDNFKNTSFEIDESMPVTELSKQFKATFGCSLRIYTGKKLADGRMTIRTLNQRTSLEVNKDAEKLKIKATEKIGDVEAKFLNHFGIKVRIADKHDGNLVSGEITLGEASRL